MRQMRLDVWVVAVAAGLLMAASPAGAQTVAQPHTRLFIGGTGGVTAVQNVGGVFGGEVGFRVTPWFDVLGEGLYFTDIATRRHIEAAEAVAAAIQQNQGQPCTGTVKSPTFLYVGGVRASIYQDRGFRIFAEGTVGAGAVDNKPTFTLNGVDITSKLQQFGIALGTDLSGTSTHPAFGGAIGVEQRSGVWYFDAHFGVTSIQTPGQSSKVLQAAATIGRAF